MADILRDRRKRRQICFTNGIDRRRPSNRLSVTFLTLFDRVRRRGDRHYTYPYYGVASFFSKSDTYAL